MGDKITIAPTTAGSTTPETKSPALSPPLCNEHSSTELDAMTVARLGLLDSGQVFGGIETAVEVAGTGRVVESEASLVFLRVCRLK